MIAAPALAEPITINVVDPMAARKPKQATHDERRAQERARLVPILRSQYQWAVSTVDAEYRKMLRCSLTDLERACRTDAGGADEFVAACKAAEIPTGRMTLHGDHLEVVWIKSDESSIGMGESIAFSAAFDTRRYVPRLAGSTTCRGDDAGACDDGEYVGGEVVS